MADTAALGSVTPPSASFSARTTSSSDDCAIYFSRCDFIITAAKAGDEKRGVAVKLHYDHNARQSDQPTLELGKWTGAQLKTYYGPRQRR